MNERLVEDWLTKATERSYQTPFAQSLLAEGMQILRLGHSPHEHGKDIIAIDKNNQVHAYQLKDGDLDLKEFEKELGQISALVQTPAEHPSISGNPRHQPWLVVSGELSIPAADRIRAYNIGWKRQKLKPLKTIVGSQILASFGNMAFNFWPQKPEDSHRLFNLYLADGVGNLDRESFSKLIRSIILIPDKPKKTDIIRKLAAANLFASYALSPFYKTGNYWEILQGWTIVAADIAWAAKVVGLSDNLWKPTFRLAVNEAIAALDLLAVEALVPDALRPMGFCELDEITRSRNTICAGIISAKVLIARNTGNFWEHEALGGKTIEELFKKKRLLIWGESAVPFFLSMIWALDILRGDQFSDRILFATLSTVVNNNRGASTSKLSSPYDSADEANAKIFRQIFNGERATELQAAVSHTLDSLVTIVARRMWRNRLAMFWSQITKIDLNHLVPDHPHDILLWRWGYERGVNQARKYPPTQSWKELLIESRRSEDGILPSIIKEEFDFALLFFLCFPHRLSRPMAKYFEKKTGYL